MRLGCASRSGVLMDGVVRTGHRHMGLLLVLAAGCTATESPPVEGESVTAAVQSATEAFLDAQRARAPEDAIRLLAPEFYMYADGVRLGYDSVTAQIRRTLPALTHLEPTWDRVEVRPLGPNHALVTATFRDFIIGAEGDTSRLRGPTTLVWRRYESGWKIIYADAVHYPDSLP